MGIGAEQPPNICHQSGEADAEEYLGTLREACREKGRYWNVCE